MSVAGCAARWSISKSSKIRSASARFADSLSRRPPRRGEQLDKGLAGLVPGPDQHRLADGHPLQLARGLERPNEPVIGHLIRFHTGHVGPVHLDGPAVRLVEAGDEVEQRRFPGAVRTDESGDRPALDRERGVVRRGEAAERLLKIVDAQDGVLLGERTLTHRHHLPSARGRRKMADRAPPARRRRSARSAPAVAGGSPAAGSA